MRLWRTIKFVFPPFSSMGNAIRSSIKGTDEVDAVPKVLAIMPKQVSSTEADFLEIKNLFAQCCVLPICVTGSVWRYDFDNLDRIAKLINQHNVSDLASSIDNIGAIVQWLRYLIKLNEVERNAQHGGDQEMSTTIEDDDDDDVDVILDNAARERRSECEAQKESRHLVSQLLAKIYYVCLDLSFKRGAKMAPPSSSSFIPTQSSPASRRPHRSAPAMAPMQQPPECGGDSGDPNSKNSRSSTLAGMMMMDAKRARRVGEWPSSSSNPEPEKLLSSLSAPSAPTDLQLRH